MQVPSLQFAYFCSRDNINSLKLAADWPKLVGRLDHSSAQGCKRVDPGFSPGGEGVAGTLGVAESTGHVQKMLLHL